MRGNVYGGTPKISLALYHRSLIISVEILRATNSYPKTWSLNCVMGRLMYQIICALLTWILMKEFRPLLFAMFTETICILLIFDFNILTKGLRHIPWHHFLSVGVELFIPPSKYLLATLKHTHSHPSVHSKLGRYVILLPRGSYTRFFCKYIPKYMIDSESRCPYILGENKRWDNTTYLPSEWTNNSKRVQLTISAPPMRLLITYRKFPLPVHQWRLFLTRIWMIMAYYAHIHNYWAPSYIHY